MQFYAKDIMTEDLITARPEMTSEELMTLLVANQISGAPVVDGDGNLIGVISMYDVLNSEINFPYLEGYFDSARLDRTLAKSGLHTERVPGGFVSDFMTYKVHTAEPTTTVEDLATLMYQGRVHRVIVLEPGTRRPIGLVSTFDLLKILSEAATRPAAQSV